MRLSFRIQFKHEFCVICRKREIPEGKTIAKRYNIINRGTSFILYRDRDFMTASESLCSEWTETTRKLHLCRSKRKFEWSPS